jgi:hypothetical protein
MVAKIATFIVVAPCGIAVWQYPFWQARQSVKENLLDPDSATFKELFRRGNYICGEVNAKNSYGGYVGFKRFAVWGQIVWIEKSESGSDKDKKIAAFYTSQVDDACNEPSVPVKANSTVGYKPKEVPLSSPVPRSAFEDENYEGEEAKIRDLLKHNGYSCSKFLAYAQKNHGSNVMIDCRDNGGNARTFLWSRQYNTIAGPYEAMASSK